MTLVRDADLATVLADWGVPCSSGAYVDVPGILQSMPDVAVDVDGPDVDGVGVRVAGTSHLLKIAPGSLGTPAVDDLVTVNGVAFRFRGRRSAHLSIWEWHFLAEDA